MLELSAARGDALAQGHLADIDREVNNDTLQMASPPPTSRLPTTQIAAHCPLLGERVVIVSSLVGLDYTEKGWALDFGAS